MCLSCACSDRHGGGGFGRGPTFSDSKKIFVGGLAPTVTEQDFRRYFQEFGRTTDAVVMMDRDTQRSRGFGFVTFEEEVRELRVCDDGVWTLSLTYGTAMLVL